MIVKNGVKIGEHELICTRIDRWTERDTPPKNIGKMKDCGHSELHDSKLDENFLKNEALDILEFLQIKLAMDLAKMLKRIDPENPENEKRKHKSNLI